MLDDIKHNTKHYVKIISISIGIFLVGFLMVDSYVSAETGGDDAILINMEASYSKQSEAITLQIQAHCNQEVAIAKRKLENHFADKAPLDDEKLGVLTEKAKGINLSCRNGF